MDSVELVFAHKPRQGEIAELEQKGDVLVLHDSDGAVVTQVNGADAILRIHLPSFWGGRYITIDQENAEMLCFEPKPEAKKQVRQLIQDCLSRHPVEAAAAMRQKGKRDLLIGGGALLLGGAITAVSFSATSANGKFMVMTGLLAVGVFEILRGVYWMVKASKLKPASEVN